MISKNCAKKRIKEGWGGGGERRRGLPADQHIHREDDISKYYSCYCEYEMCLEWSQGTGNTCGQFYFYFYFYFLNINVVPFTLIHITRSIIWDEGDCVSKWADFCSF
jgi:hypothetical protein